MRAYPGLDRLWLAEEILDSLIDDPFFCQSVPAELTSAIAYVLESLEDTRQGVGISWD